MRTGSVYRIDRISTGEFYIGCTFKEVELRIKKHFDLRLPKYCSSRKLFTEPFIENDWTWIVLETISTSSKYELYKLETFYVVQAKNAKEKIVNEILSVSSNSVLCSCKGWYRRDGKSRHYKSILHMNWEKSRIKPKPVPKPKPVDKPRRITRWSSRCFVHCPHMCLHWTYHVNYPDHLSFNDIQFEKFLFDDHSSEDHLY